MKTTLIPLLSTLAGLFRSRARLHLEVLALRQQLAMVTRLIGSIRRECLNHVIVYNDCHLKRLLRSYFAYYHTARTHLALDKQCPQPRLIENRERGKIIAFPHLGGLHHEYRRVA